MTMTGFSGLVLDLNVIPFDRSDGAGDCVACWSMERDYKQGNSGRTIKIFVSICLLSGLMHRPHVKHHVPFGRSLRKTIKPAGRSP
jgi:hypothetical protein